MKATVYIALTVDGLIAEENGSVDFLNEYNSSASEEDGDMGFSAFLGTVDLLVMGRKTWDTVVSFGPDVWPYGDRAVWIWSKQDPSKVNIPQRHDKRAKVIGASPPDILKMAEEKGYCHAYVDGGTTIQEFLQHGCVQELILTRVPLLLGSGVALFLSDVNKLQLEHLKTQAYSNGLVQSHYQVKKEK